MDLTINKQLTALYRAHYNATEASKLINLPYNDTAAAFRLFKKQGISKFSRLALIPNITEVLDDVDSAG